MDRKESERNAWGWGGETGPALARRVGAGKAGRAGWGRNGTQRDATTWRGLRRYARRRGFARAKRKSQTTPETTETLGYFGYGHIGQGRHTTHKEHTKSTNTKNIALHFTALRHSRRGRRETRGGPLGLCERATARFGGFVARDWLMRRLGLGLGRSRPSSAHWAIDNSRVSSEAPNFRRLFLTN